MKKNGTRTERQETKAEMRCSAAWGGAKPTTDNVAFRVTDEGEQAENEARPPWEPCQLTAEEEALLSRRRDLY